VLAYLLQLRRAGPTDYVPPPVDLEVPEAWAATENTDEEPEDGEQ
jgi:hypothetical protein